MTIERPGLLADLIELGGAGLEITELDGAMSIQAVGPGVVRLGVHRGGPMPGGDLGPFDILLSVNPSAPAPWVSATPDRLDATIEALGAAVTAQPVAAATAAQVLRMTLSLPFDQAVVLESLAYSTLLASRSFQAWRAATPIRKRADGAPRVLILADGPGLELRLNRSAARNAFDTAMRDDLVEALTFALEHPDAPPVTLSGAGPAFSAGGDLDGFGRASDPGEAHLIRTLRSPVRLVHQLGDRLTAHLHGACVGAGIEVPAAAARVTARPGTTFRLPEVSMGLIPGAGGTASLPRRIGRGRTCYMALSGAEIDLATALSWGLVDAVQA